MSRRKGKRGPVTNDPAGVRAQVWLTDPAIGDLRALDGSALIWALKKMLLLERNPLAGEPLGSGLTGWRKLVVGDRHWRVIWRPITEPSGDVIVEIAEVRAIGPRSDSKVYEEMAARLTRMGDSPTRTSLQKVIDRLGVKAAVVANPLAAVRNRPETWLIERLVHTAGIDRARACEMTSEQAVDAWTEYVLRAQP